MGQFFWLARLLLNIFTLRNLLLCLFYNWWCFWCLLLWNCWFLRSFLWHLRFWYLLFVIVLRIWSNDNFFCPYIAFGWFKFVLAWLKLAFNWFGFMLNVLWLPASFMIRLNTMRWWIYFWPWLDRFFFVIIDADEVVVFVFRNVVLNGSLIMTELHFLIPPFLNYLLLRIDMRDLRLRVLFKLDLLLNKLTLWLQLLVLLSLLFFILLRLTLVIVSYVIAIITLSRLIQSLIHSRVNLFIPNLVFLDLLLFIIFFLVLLLHSFIVLIC